MGVRRDSGRGSEQAHAREHTHKHMRAHPPHTPDVLADVSSQAIPLTYRSIRPKLLKETKHTHVQAISGQQRVSLGAMLGPAWNCRSHVGAIPESLEPCWSHLWSHVGAMLGHPRMRAMSHIGQFFHTLDNRNSCPFREHDLAFAQSYTASHHRCTAWVASSVGHFNASRLASSAVISFWHRSKSLLLISAHECVVFLGLEAGVASQACFRSAMIRRP